MALSGNIKDGLGSALQRFLIRFFGYRLVREPKVVYGKDVEDTVHAILKHITPKTVIDVGANDGTWMLALHEMSDHALESVFLFEPQKKYTANLEGLPLANATKKIFPFGVGSTQDARIISGGTASASYLPINKKTQSEFTGMLMDEQEQTELHTLDSIDEIEQLPTIDLLKIDVQGFELEVLKGAQKTLKKTKSVVLEASWNEYYEGQPPAWQLLEFLYKHGFQTIDFGYHWRVNYSQAKKVIQSDIIFMNANFKD